MNIVTAYIYGNTRGFEMYEREEEEAIFRSFYTGEKNVKSRLLTIVRRNDGKTYYHYLRYGTREFDTVRSANGLFGMSLAFDDNHFYPDFKGILKGFDALLEDILSAKKILEKANNDVLHFLVSKFSEQKTEMKRIESQMLELVDESKLQKYDESFSKNGKESFTLDEKATNDEILEQFKSHKIVTLRKIPSFKITYMVDGEIFKVIENVVYGTPLTPIDELPFMEGYDFSGWMNIPAIMPNEDVVIEGHYIPKEETNLSMTNDDTMLPVNAGNSSEEITKSGAKSEEKILSLYEKYAEIVSSNKKEAEIKVALTKLKMQCNELKPNKVQKEKSLLLQYIGKYLNKIEPSTKTEKTSFFDSLGETNKGVILAAALFVAVVILFFVLKGCLTQNTVENQDSNVTVNEPFFNNSAFHSYVKNKKYDDAMNELIKNKKRIQDIQFHYNILKNSMFSTLLGNIKDDKKADKLQFVNDFFNRYKRVFKELGCEKELENYQNIAITYSVMADPEYIIDAETARRIEVALNRNPNVFTDTVKMKLLPRLNNLNDEK